MQGRHGQGVGVGMEGRARESKVGAEMHSTLIIQEGHTKSGTEVRSEGGPKKSFAIGQESPLGTEEPALCIGPRSDRRYGSSLS